MLVNPTGMSSVQEAESDGPGEDFSICLAEVAEVDEKLLNENAPGMDEICPEMLKALDIAGIASSVLHGSQRQYLWNR